MLSDYLPFIIAILAAALTAILTTIGQYNLSKARLINSKAYMPILDDIESKTRLSYSHLSLYERNKRIPTNWSTIPYSIKVLLPIQIREQLKNHYATELELSELQNEYYRHMNKLLNEGKISEAFIRAGFNLKLNGNVRQIELADGSDIDFESIITTGFNLLFICQNKNKFYKDWVAQIKNFYWRNLITALYNQEPERFSKLSRELKKIVNENKDLLRDAEEKRTITLNKAKSLEQLLNKQLNRPGWRVAIGF